MQQMQDGPPQTRPQHRQSSAARLLDVLLALGEAGLQSGAVRLVDLVAITGYPRPTVHRLLNELKQSGFVSQDVSGPYRLGPKVLLLAAQFRGGMDIRRTANPVMQAFGERFGHTVHLGIRDGTEIVYIDKVEPPSGTLVGSMIGQRRPIPVTALGKAILAYSSPELINEITTQGWTRRTPNTLPGPRALRAQIIEIRADGYALDDEESDLGLRCAAAPVFNHAGVPIAAISVTTLASQVSRHQLSAIAGNLATEANNLTKLFGGHHPGDAGA